MTKESGAVYLAVLPLEVMSADPRADMLCRGLVMDLITDLSRFRSFHIIAYESVKEIRSTEIPNGEPLAGLRLDYFVKGMARERDGNVILNLQLMNARDGRLVWAEKFDGGFDDLFAIQEDIVEKIAQSLQQSVDYDLLGEVRTKPLTSLSAYECWLSGYQELKNGTLEADGRARDFFRQAMEIDPHYARAYTGMSLSYFNEWSCQLWSRWDVSKNGAFEWAQKAIELDDRDHVSNAITGRIYLFNGEYEKAEHFLRKSLRMNPNDAEMLLVISFGFAFLGYLKEAKELYERAQRLNPADNFGCAACGAFIHFESGEIDEAIALAAGHETGRGWVDFPAYQAAAYYLKGDMDKMRERWGVFLSEFSQKINGGEPADGRTAIQWMKDVNPYRGGTRLQPFWEFMSGEGSKDSGAPDPPVGGCSHFVREGAVWRLSYAGTEVTVHDLKGLHDIARLLGEPGRAVHCTELMGAQIMEKGQPVFDERAKADYQKRIIQLQNEIREAGDSLNDERLEALHGEYDMLLEHLGRAVGKGGRPRKVAGTVEKCRSAVTWRIRSAVKKIALIHPPLAKHLGASLKTGVFCEYVPEYDIDWIL